MTARLPDFNYSPSAGRGVIFELDEFQTSRVSQLRPVLITRGLFEVESVTVTSGRRLRWPGLLKRSSGGSFLSAARDPGLRTTAGQLAEPR